jgi:putative molybdopterin biosynthesis protein
MKQHELGQTRRKTMAEEQTLNVQGVADILHVSKGTVYDLIKRGEISSFRVGRKVRFTRRDVEDYIENAKTAVMVAAGSEVPASSGVHKVPDREKGFIICGQDLILDVLSNYMRLNGVPALRAYIGSYESLVLLYQGKVRVATSHLWDGDDDQYNVPFVRRLIPGVPATIIHLAYRMQGFYVAKGNPKHIGSWEDFRRPDITMVNREKGAGSRVLLDEHLRLLHVKRSAVRGYETEVQSHLAVASAVSSGEADVAVGTEKIARQVENIDFVPMQKERYEMVILQEDLETPEIQTLLRIIRSKEVKREFDNIGGYDTSEMGRLVAET